MNGHLDIESKYLPKQLPLKNCITVAFTTSYIEFDQYKMSEIHRSLVFNGSMVQWFISSNHHKILQ